MKYLKNSNKGFTLVEVLIVVVILGLIVGFAYPAVIDVYNDIRVKSMVIEENHVRNAAKMYVEDCFNTQTKDALNGCSNADIMSDSGHVFLGDMVYDGYTEEVKFGDLVCDGYVEFNYEEYKVCIKCGPTYKTPDLHCTFDYEDTKFTTFNYTGAPQTFQVPQGKAGSYRVELWGASGTTSGVTAYGAYTSGVIKLKENDVLYIYVGQSNPVANGTAWNGGQSSGGGTPGGGATDVRLSKSSNPLDPATLPTRIMVAAGGGGGSNGAAGGGLTGYTTGSLTNAGTQIYGGQSSTDTYKGSFGQGGNGCGGGGGYYGGAGTDCSVGGGSGSSYISGHTGCIAVASASNLNPKNGCNQLSSSNTTCGVHYTGKKFSTTVMIDGNGYSWTTSRVNKRTSMPSKDYGKFYELGKGHVGNGYARIVYLGR